ncbi:putative motility protein [Oceanobacillus arenosus]|uniref:Putative motility protein n=1 Tax=Oceanobacillus arenosus TaxID=1229153 RepID=A0A3D8Q1S5_9BACI|nr:YjfB family protein [Oceanobacillus arenosus]RDW22234.1 putative motility protein [Oceanobacillus arenosus]
MDIAALSVAMAQNQVRTEAGFTLMDKVMNMSEQQSGQLNEMLGQSVTHSDHPSLGTKVDLRA